MRPLIIALFIMILLTANILSCSGDEAFAPADNASGNAGLSNLWAAETHPAIPQEANNSTTNTSDGIIPGISKTIPARTDTSDSKGFKVVGYITHWHLNRLSNVNLDGLTHLIWQGVEVTSSGDPTLRVANNAGWWQIKDVVGVGHFSGVKVLASLIGHWDESVINAIWRVESYRKQLVTNLVELVKSYNLDGIDIDNENKGWDVNLYSTFIKELHDELSPLGKIISVAGSPYRVCLTPDVYSMVDFVNLMTYDMGVPDHSTFEDGMQAIDLWVEEGVPKQKLLIGIPCYGRDGDDSFYEYWWIIDNYSPAPNQNEVSEPEAYGAKIWWNGLDLAKQKVLYMKNNSFGGVMLYELGQDSLNESSLLLGVYEALGLPAKP